RRTISAHLRRYRRRVGDELIVIDGCTMFMSRRNGDVEAGDRAGYFFQDVRHLSRWELLVDGKPLDALVGEPVDYFSARIVSATSMEDDPRLSVRRDRFVTDGVTEALVDTNPSDE